MLYLPSIMAKIAFSCLAIFCLLLLASANAITTSIEKEVRKEVCTDPERGADQTAPSPAEEDTAEEDDDNSKLFSLYQVNSDLDKERDLILGGHYLTSFLFLEIISPPPQA